VKGLLDAIVEIDAAFASAWQLFVAEDAGPLAKTCHW